MPKKEDIKKLRMEWLKYKSLFEDMLIQVPSLPVVIDKMRDIFGESKRLGIIYITISERIEAIYGWQVFEEIYIDIIEHLKKTVVTDFPEHSQIATVAPKSGEVIILIPIGKDKDSNILESYYLTISDYLNNFLKNLDVLKAIQPVIRTGRHLLFYDPIARYERLIYQGLRSASIDAWKREEDILGRRIQELEWIIKNNMLITMFQPIVNLEDLKIYGYEALSRAKGAKEFYNTDILFDFVVSTNYLLELERICRINAVTNFQKPDNTNLFINISANAIYDPELYEDSFVHLIKARGLKPEDIVFEITERMAILDFDTFKTAADKLKDKGFQLAIDDVGAGYSSLHTIAEIMPKYLKYDIALVKNIDKDLIKKSMLETLIPFVDKIGAHLIAEGIETIEEYEVIKEIGVPLGQGFLFAQPSEPPPVVKIKNIWER